LSRELSSLEPVSFKPGAGLDALRAVAVVAAVASFKFSGAKDLGDGLGTSVLLAAKSIGRARKFGSYHQFSQIESIGATFETKALIKAITSWKKSQGETTGMKGEENSTCPVSIR
jgi:hypothetical protein